ncbi:IclR family transcriptional regulator [Caldimonas tepidiphila]|uniref:IclR family transcriptional regulator n=1 Tax=Caldimonas tepidiphila TaxID=2315841 RepID=UPI000E5C3D61|nr:IclR family transcriptional regulator [Caldimonas tepidiphila]
MSVSRPDPATTVAPNEDRAQRAIQSVEVGGRLLLVLGERSAPMTLKDLAEAAGLPASRAHPYLVSFGRLGLVAQDPGTGRYALGPAALQLGLACLRQLDPLKVASPIAEALAERIDQTVALAVWANFGPTVVRIIESTQPVHVNMRVGTVMDLEKTATGQVFAAFLPARKLVQLAAGPLGGQGGALLPGAVGMPDEERAAALEEVRQRGLARAVGQPIPGVNAFSAPVFDHAGDVELVLTALGPAVNFPSAWNSPIARAVGDAARSISERLGWRA